VKKTRGIPPTVGNFLAVLTSQLTQYDQKTSLRERHVNIYRLGHLLRAAQRVEDEMLRKADKQAPMTLELADEMITTMSGAFSVGRDGQFDLAPCRNVVKQLRAFVEKGKNPSLVG